MNESFWWENEEKFELREIYFQEKNMKIDHAVQLLIRLKIFKAESDLRDHWTDGSLAMGIAWISSRFDF